MLLMHGPRASYLPSPYVDAHGERHGSFRGQPLFLDPKRLEMVRAMVAAHEVPSKVVHARSTSQKLIIAGYY